MIRFIDEYRDRFGVELICVLDSPGDRDVRVNDPVNPGRMYPGL